MHTRMQKEIGKTVALGLKNFQDAKAVFPERRGNQVLSV